MQWLKRTFRIVFLTKALARTFQISVRVIITPLKETPNAKN